MYSIIGTEREFVVECGDFVTKILKQFLTFLCISFTSWIISYLFIMLSLVLNQFHLIFIIFSLIMAIMGSLIGTTSVLLIFSNLLFPKFRVKSRSVRMQQQLYSQSLRPRISIDPCETGQMYSDDLPLIRRVVFCTSVWAIYLISTLISEILLVLHLGFQYVINIGLWISLLPLLVVIFIILVYIFTLKTLSLPSCSHLFLLYLNAILFIAKCHGDIHTSWTLVSIPILYVQISWISHLLSHSPNISNYSFKSKKNILILAYLISLTLMIIAQIITCAEDITYLGSLHIWTSDKHFKTSSRLPILLWLVGGIVFSCTALSVFRNECVKVIQAKGYCKPVALSRTQLGWEPTPALADEEDSLLLGTTTTNNHNNIDVDIGITNL